MRKSQSLNSQSTLKSQKRNCFTTQLKPGLRYAGPDQVRNCGLSNWHVKDTCRSRADRSTPIKAQISALNMATERGTSDKTEATRFSPCAHDHRRRLEAEAATASDMCPINFRWEETYTPTTLPRSRSPHISMIRLGIYYIIDSSVYYIISS